MVKIDGLTLPELSWKLINQMLDVDTGLEFVSDEQLSLDHDEAVEMQYIQDAINAFVFILDPNKRGIFSCIKTIDGSVDYEISHKEMA